MKLESASKRRLAGLLLGAAVLGAPLTAAAQAFPTKPVKIVVSFAAGGTTDILARLIAQKLTESMGQSFIVENRPGAGGIIGNDHAAKSAADGYTLLLGSASSLAVNVSLYSKFPYDPEKDLVPLTQVASGPFLVVVNPSVPAKNMQELIDLVKAKPESIRFGTSGNGTSLHLAGELINSMAGIKMVHVPYKGAGPATLDTLSGQIEMTIGDMPPMAPHLASGKLRAIAQTTATRSRLLPDLPTVAESALPGYDATSWYGFMVPAGTPRPIMDQLNAAIAKALQAPDVRERYAQLGIDPISSSPEEFGDYIRAEKAKWADVVKRSGAKI